MFDSRQANVAFYNKILRRFDMPILAEDDTDIVYMYTGEDSVNYLFRDDPRLAEAQEYRKHVGYDQFIPLMVMEPHLEEVLGTLRERYHLAVATNRTSSIYTILDLFDLKQYFDLVVCALDVEIPKPHPETALRILNHFEAAPSETIYIGDMEVDQTVTREADIPFVAYKNPSLQANYHIKDLREVLNLLAQSG
jgi:HAD superfamily hydrolase (TIGR01509 family)